MHIQNHNEAIFMPTPVQEMDQVLIDSTYNLYQLQRMKD